MSLILNDPVSTTHHEAPWSDDNASADKGPIEIAIDLAEEFREGAVQRDQSNQRPLAELERLRESNLVNLLIPRELGGGGGSIRDAAQVILELTKGDASIATVLAFHYYNSQIPRYLDYKTDAEAIQRASARKRWIWGNSTQYVNKGFFAEPHADGGYTVSGTKTWNTGAPLADVMTVLAIHPNKEQYIYGYIPTDRAGLRFHDDWDQLGLRGADSGTITFENVRIFPDEVLPWTHAGVQTGPAPFWTTFGAIFYSAVFLGSSLAVLDAVRDYSRTQRRQVLYPPGVDRATNDPLIQTQYAELLIKVQAGLAFLDQVTHEVQQVWNNRRIGADEDRGRVSLRTLALRAFTANVALEVTPKLYDFTGGRATGRAYGFDRHWRNVRQLSVHDPLIYSVRTLGDCALNDKLPPTPNLFKAHAKAPTDPDLPVHDPTLPLDTTPRNLGVSV